MSSSSCFPTHKPIVFFSSLPQPSLQLPSTFLRTTSQLSAIQDSQQGQEE